MECSKCGLAIEGGRHGDNAIVVSNGMLAGFAGIDRYVGAFIRYPECVGDPTRIPDDQFKKWVVAQIRATQQAASSQVHNHNDLVDALEQLHPGIRAAYEQILLRRDDGEIAARYGATPSPPFKAEETVPRGTVN